MNFVADMGKKPTPKHTLERIDTDKGYEPGNCRWASHTEQMNNRSINRVIVAFGRTHTLAEWCRELGMERETIRDRLARGATPEEALSSGRFVSARIGRPRLIGPLRLKQARKRSA